MRKAILGNDLTCKWYREKNQDSLHEESSCGFHANWSSAAINILIRYLTLCKRRMIKIVSSSFSSTCHKKNEIMLIETNKVNSLNSVFLKLVVAKIENV